MAHAKVLMCSRYAEKFHQENHDHIKNFAISIAIVRNMVTFFTYVAANNTCLLHQEMTEWSNTVRVQLLEKMKFVVFVLKLSIYLISEHLNFV